MLPLSPNLGGRFDRSLWQAYVSVNKIFADKILEVINPEDDFVWVHDYHLMVLPTFLRKRFNWVKLGFFLHSPFPSFEIYKTLPVREELLRALLNSDLIGFHTFDYARHFLSCCGRMLGLTYESKRGYIGLEYYGRTVSIKILCSTATTSRNQPTSHHVYCKLFPILNILKILKIFFLAMSIASSFQVLANFSLKKAEKKEGVSQMSISKLTKEEKKESEKSPQVQIRKMRHSPLCFAPEFDGCTPSRLLFLIHKSPCTFNFFY